MWNKIHHRNIPRFAHNYHISEWERRKVLTCLFYLCTFIIKRMNGLSRTESSLVLWSSIVSLNFYNLCFTSDILSTIVNPLMYACIQPCKHVYTLCTVILMVYLIEINFIWFVNQIRIKSNKYYNRSDLHFILSVWNGLWCDGYLWRIYFIVLFKHKKHKPYDIRFFFFIHLPSI